MVLTVVGKAESRREFERILDGRLADGFNINQVVPLAVDEEAKRFLAYVMTDVADVDVNVVNAMAEFLQDIKFDVVVHEDARVASEYAVSEYGDEAYSTFNDPITSAEIFQRDVFFGLITTGEITMFRGRLDDKPVIILAHHAVGMGHNDQVATPMAVMVDNDIAGRLSLPVKSSHEK